MAEPMSEERLAEIRARCEAATKGPWRASGQKGYIMPSHREPYKVAQLGGTMDCPGQIARTDDRLPHDTDFIAFARQDVPDLLAEVERLRAIVVQLLALTDRYVPINRLPDGLDAIRESLEDRP